MLETSLKKKGGNNMKIKSCLLYICILFLFSTIVCVKNVYAAHEHSYETIISYKYTYKDETSHTCEKVVRTFCKGCNIDYSNTVSSVIETHSYSSMTWSGQNYHSGLKHYGYYTKTCTTCKHTYGEWRSWNCPGGSNGNCVLPQSLEIDKDVV